MKRFITGFLLLLFAGYSLASDCLRESLVQDLSDNPALLNAIQQDRSLVGSWEKLQNVGSPLRTNPDWLVNAKNWDANGVHFSGNGNYLDIVDSSGSTIGKIENGILTPTQYSQTGTPIGNVVNGYQLVDVSGQLKLKRVPDISLYSQSELDTLYQHQNAHVLERHGHDVTDAALDKRAMHGVAPDGHHAKNPPDFSSKFESPDRLKDALNNTQPGTPNFNPPSSGTSYVFDYPANGQASTPFGYGIPSGGGSAVDMFRVKVVYRKQNGIWRLITMYPQL